MSVEYKSVWQSFATTVEKMISLLIMGSSFINFQHYSEPHGGTTRVIQGEPRGGRSCPPKWKSLQKFSNCG